MAILMCGRFLLGPAPFFVVLLFLLWRNANLAGGFAGRFCLSSGCFCCFCCDLWICHLGPWVLFTHIFTAYAIVRTEPSALSAMLDEKKRHTFEFTSLLQWSPSLTLPTSAIFYYGVLQGLQLFRHICSPFAILSLIVALLLWVHPIFEHLQQFLLISHYILRHYFQSAMHFFL